MKNDTKDLGVPTDREDSDELTADTSTLRARQKQLLRERLRTLITCAVQLKSLLRECGQEIGETVLALRDLGVPMRGIAIGVRDLYPAAGTPQGLYKVQLLLWKRVGRARKAPKTT